LSESIVKPETILDVMVLFNDKLEMNNKQFDDAFDVEENENEIVLKQKNFMKDRKLWLQILDLVKSWGGKSAIQPRRFIIPKPQKIEPKIISIDEIIPPSQNQGVTPHVVTMDKNEPVKKKETTVENIRRSAKDIGQLYPVLVDADTGEILDGRNRLKADPDWKKRLVKTKDKLEKLKVKHHANWHRKTISRQKVLTEIAEETGWRGLAPFANFLDVSKVTISKYLPQKYRKQIHRSKELTPLTLFENFNFALSTWEAEEERPEGYGSKDFHGNCSPTIIYGLLSRYATQNDVILDPMAGSGTFFDVGKAMGFKKILVRDVRSVRGDILKADAEKTGLEDESVDFIFTHFPYWRLIQYTENDDADLSRLTFAEFISKTDRIFREMHRVLKKNKFFAVMIGNMRKAKLLDIETEFSLLGRQYFTLWDKIIKQIRTWKPETHGQRMGLAIARAKARKSTVINHDTILVFRKD